MSTTSEDLRTIRDINRKLFYALKDGDPVLIAEHAKKLGEEINSLDAKLRVGAPLPDRWAR